MGFHVTVLDLTGKQGFDPVIAGTQEIRLARTNAEIHAAQSLRYRVFYEEMGATPLPEVRKAARDFDRFDAVCDHIVVIDHARADNATGVVGTYRVLRREHAQKAGGFYSAAEFDVSML